MGNPIQIAFHLQSPTPSSSSAGWYVDGVQVVFEAFASIPPRVLISRVDAGVVQLCPDALQSGVAYLLESCDGLSDMADPNHWAPLALFEDATCQTVDTETTRTRFFRIRTTDAP